MKYYTIEIPKQHFIFTEEDIIENLGPGPIEVSDVLDLALAEMQWNIDEKNTEADKITIFPAKVNINSLVFDSSDRILGYIPGK